ncbi:hypothetical protein STENM223S_11112 [Streptomyces tendae]
MPLSASGTRTTMISALKTTADRIAESGEDRRMTLSLSRPGWTAAKSAGMIAKYLATSLAMENVVSAPRVISNCLPISTISMSLVGSESRSTMLPASLAADVPVFIATPTSAWASAGASLVPSPVIATSLPPASRLMSAILSSGVASARKSSTPASSAIALAVRVVARDHDGSDAHAAQLSEAFPHARLDHVLEVDDAQDPCAALVLDRYEQAAYRPPRRWSWWSPPRPRRPCRPAPRPRRRPNPSRPCAPCGRRRPRPTCGSGR